MASKIQSYKFYVAIKPYKLEGISDEYNEVSVYVNYDSNRKHFYVSLHAGWCGGSFHGCTLYDGRGWLTDTQFVILKDSPKNSQKTINEMGAALELAKADIAWLFDERMWTELKQFVKDVALCGYTAMLEERIRSYKHERTVTAQVNAAKDNNSSTNENSTTMAQNVKAADLIGKVIIVGNNQGKFIVKSAQDNGMLACEFSKAGETTTTSMTVTMPNLQAMTERGLWKISDANEPSAVSPQTSDIKTEADVAEVEDIVPVVTPKKSEGRGKKEEKPQPSAVSPQTSKGKLTYETYDVTKTNKETGEDYTVQNAKIVGFDLTDPVYLAGPSFLGAMLPETIGGKKVGTLRFSHKWATAAKDICDKLNAGGGIADCVAIMEQAKADRKQRREDRKAKREERKAQTSAVSPQPSKGYSDKDVADMLKKIMAGGDVPEDIKKLLQAA